MAQSKEFVDASHALNDLSHELALLESENASLRDAVDGLCNENAKLRAYSTRLEQANIVLDSDNCELRNDMKDMQFFIDENRRLRELLQDAWGYINHPANATWTHKKRKEVRDSLADRMRELGVEVDA